MEGNNTEQDDLLAKINGLTSGMNMTSSQPQAPSMPQAAPTMNPMMNQGPMASPVPEVQSVPSYQNQGDMQQMQSFQQTSTPDYNPMNNPAMNNQSINSVPEMPSSNYANDSFAASLGAVPVTEDNQDQGIPTMGSRIPVPDNKIPTFDKPAKKKSNGAFGFIVTLLIIAIIGAGAFALYTNGVFDKYLNPKQTVPFNNVNTDPIEDPFEIDPIDQQVVTPVKNAEFVDRTVTAGVNDKVIIANYAVDGLDYDANYIQLPYLNINSEDAKKINEDIQNKYKDYANISADYKTENQVGIVNNDPNFKQRYLIVYYQAITQGDVISLLINELKYDGVDSIWTHYTYCISSSTGKKLGLNDLQTILNVDNSAMNTAYESYVVTLISSLTDSDAKKTFEHKLNAYRTLVDYYNNVNKGEGISYYVDGMGRLNIITKLYIGSKNIYKVVAYSPTTGCVVKDFKINDAKSAVGYAPMIVSSEENIINGEAVMKTASSNLKVSAKTLSALSDGDLVYGEDIKKIYRAYEYLLGSKGESITLQYKNDNGSKSYSKGEYDNLDADVINDSVYRLSIIKYSSGGYRIIKFELEK